ncbi:hypothetical protein [Massilia pseudoviolaceinigra]|uniref:hypothetical protein n=1 Tax=Massilia pseudoviolaceinigra TaxID=3057165 RepID=UPI002796A6ED|nr:hypothetical protein [Massilia sp. CCM 9206]MDQ1923340.1 hypothetical protein [Massilia sp. CCM 9206]
MKLNALANAILLAFAAAGLPAIAQEEATMFEPGSISDGGVFGLTLSPDGAHALWVNSGGKRDKLVIMEAFKKHGKWQQQTVVPFSGNPEWKDIDPAFSPDGRQVIFQSTRPVHGKPDRKGFDIWSVARTDSGWAAPVHLGNVINTDESESSASMASNGSIYFHKAVGGNSDLWVSRLVRGAYQTPENVGTPINTAAERESNPYVAPDESYLIYFSTIDRAQDTPDLLISLREKGGWGTPTRIAPPINSNASEFTPWMHAKRLYFSRQVKREGGFIENIYSHPFDPMVHKTKDAHGK